MNMFGAVCDNRLKQSSSMERKTMKKEDRGYLDAVNNVMAVTWHDNQCVAAPDCNGWEPLGGQEGGAVPNPVQLTFHRLA